MALAIRGISLQPATGNPWHAMAVIEPSSASLCVPGLNVAMAWALRTGHKCRG